MRISRILLLILTGTALYSCRKEEKDTKINTPVSDTIIQPPFTIVDGGRAADQMEWINENVAFAIFEDVSNVPGKAVFKSIDAGITWDQKVILDSSWGRHLSFYNEESGLVVSTNYTLDKSEILITENGGDKWSSIYTVESRVLWAERIDEKSIVVAENILDSISQTTTFNIRLSEDKGITWILVESHSISGFVEEIDLDFLTPHIGFVFGGKRLLKTTNGGLTWNELPYVNFDLQYFDFFNENQGVAISPEGEYFTLDGGNTWERSKSNSYYTQKNHSFPGVSICDIQYTDENTVISIGAKYLYKSEDGGKSFNQMDWSMCNSEVNIYVDFISIFMINSDTGMALVGEFTGDTHSPGYTNYLIKTTNGWECEIQE